MSKPATIRWDRLSRYGLLFVLVILMALYVNPLRNYLSTRSESHRRAAEVSTLERENHRLLAKKRALTNKGVLEEEARKLGMLRPGELGYVVKDLPSGE